MRWGSGLLADLFIQGGWLAQKAQNKADDISTPLRERSRRNPKPFSLPSGGRLRQLPLFPDRRHSSPTLLRSNYPLQWPLCGNCAARRAFCRKRLLAPSFSLPYFPPPPLPPQPVLMPLPPDPRHLPPPPLLDLRPPSTPQLRLPIGHRPPPPPRMDSRPSPTPHSRLPIM